MIDTAVVLARGLGTRMRADSTADLTDAQRRAAASGHKALMPIGEHCLIDYSLSALADAGVRRAVLVVAPDHAEFAEHFRSVAPQRLTIDFAVQDEPQGTAHALASAREVVGEDRFVMVNGDNVYPTEGLRALLAQNGHALLGFDRAALVEHSNIPAERISAFALVQQQDSMLTDIVEKPDAAVVDAAGEHAMVSMNCFAFTPEVFDACERIEPSARGEYEIVDAVRLLGQVRVVPFAGGVVDLSRRDDIDDVEARLADRAVQL